VPFDISRPSRSWWRASAWSQRHEVALIQLGEYAPHDRHLVPGRAALPGRLARGRARVDGTRLFLLKAVVVFLVVTWVRWSFVRIRVDQILAISWKLLLPATLVLLMAAALVVASAGGA